MKVELKMLPSEAVLQNHGLQEGGSVQKLVDNETMRYMSAYMPRRQAGELEQYDGHGHGDWIRPD